MKLRLIAQGMEILSTPNQELIYNQPVLFNGENIKMQFNINTLQTLLDWELSEPRLFSEVLKNLTVIRGLTTYKNADGLKLYLYEDGKHLAVLSAGESQPALFKVFIEVMFEKDFS